MSLKQELKNWVLKDRNYVLRNGLSPLTYKIRGVGLNYFDEDQKINRTIRYATNQNSMFVDEQDDTARLSHIVFSAGSLHVPRENYVLQQILSLTHPQRDDLWFELDHQKIAEDELTKIERELDAVTMVATLEIEHLEAILRTEMGSAVTELSSKELKRDCYVFAKKNPKLFIELANDEDIKLRNLANRSVEAGILKLTDDNTVFKLANGKKIMTVPFDQHPYGALAQFFKTDEGVDIMKSIIKKLA